MTVDDERLWVDVCMYPTRLTEIEQDGFEDFPDAVHPALAILRCRLQLDHIGPHIISPQWQIETEPDNTSEVEVRFVAETPQRTRVELEHRHLDRHGPGWQAVSDGVAHDEGWSLYLTRYAALSVAGS